MARAALLAFFAAPAAAACRGHRDCPEGKYCDTAKSCYACDYCCQHMDTYDHGECPPTCACGGPPPPSVLCTDTCGDHSCCTDDNKYCDAAHNCYDCDYCCSHKDTFDGGLCPQACGCGGGCDHDCCAHSDCSSGDYCDTDNECYHRKYCLWLSDGVDGSCPASGGGGASVSARVMSDKAESMRMKLAAGKRAPIRQARAKHGARPMSYDTSLERTLNSQAKGKKCFADTHWFHNSHGNAKQGAPCMVPFTYHGVTYHSCTSAGHDTKWCYTDTAGHWGNCKCIQNGHEVPAARYAVTTAGGAAAAAGGVPASAYILIAAAVAVVATVARARKAPPAAEEGVPRYGAVDA